MYPHSVVPPQLPSIPLGHRKKANGLCATMDHLIENDTQDFMWHLNKSESREFLDELFPNFILFQSPNADLTMAQVLCHLCERGLLNKKGNHDYWMHFLKSTKGPHAEVPMAQFLNSVLGAVEECTQMSTHW